LKPLYEVTQIKGDGEAHPFLSSEDEFADYGTWDKADIAGMKPKQDEMLQYEYARVLEIPTPTWQAYDMAFYGHKMEADVPLSHQERAYTSPIWYTP